MNCRKVNSLLSAYIDSELPGVEQLQIRRHLGECRACRDEYESLLFTKRLVSGLRMQDPRPGFEHQLLERIGVEGDQQSRRIGFHGWWLYLGQSERGRVRLGVLCAALSAAAALLIAMPSGTGDRPLEPIPPAPAATAFYPGAPVPVQEYLTVQHTWDSAQPMNSGANAVPLGRYWVQLEPSR